MFNSSGWKPAICSLALFVLVACDSAEERAEGHFESGVALIEAGDVERGIVELRYELTQAGFQGGNDQRTRNTVFFRIGRDFDFGF